MGDLLDPASLSRADVPRPTRGATLARIDRVRPGADGGTHNHLDGAVTVQPRIP